MYRDSPIVQTEGLEVGEWRLEVGLILVRHQKIESLSFHMTNSAPPFEWTAVFRESPEGGYVAFVEELPGANSQGETLAEARTNLREAVELVLEANRALAEEDLVGVRVIRERLTA